MTFNNLITALVCYKVKLQYKKPFSLYNLMVVLVLNSTPVSVVNQGSIFYLMFMRAARGRTLLVGPRVSSGSNSPWKPVTDLSN